MTDLPGTRMFTVYMPCETIHEDDVVVARNLSGADAIKAALELDGSWIAHPGEDEYGTFRLFSWRPHARKWPEDRRRLDTLSATVIKTADYAKDHALGTSMIVDQFIRRSGHYSKARVEADEDFDRRLRHVAKRREAHRLDKLIATALVDALLADGYVITDASYEEFERSTDRDAILAFLFDIEIIELIVEKGDEQSWMRLIFGENGWDLVQDHTVDLGYLIDPIVGPFLPWNRTDADRHDGSDALASNPEILPEIERMAK